MDLNHKFLAAKLDVDLGGWFVGSDPGKSNTVATTLGSNLLSTIIGVMTIIGVIYFLFQIVVAGYGMLSSEGDKKKIEDSRTRITQGLLGVVIIIMAVTLVSLVGTILGVPNILDLNAILTTIIK